MKFRWLAPPSHRDHGFRLGDSSKRQFYPSHGAHISFSSPPLPRFLPLPLPLSSLLCKSATSQPTRALSSSSYSTCISPLPPSLPRSPDMCTQSPPSTGERASGHILPPSLSFPEFNLPGRLANATWNVTHFQLSKDRSARKQSGTDCGKRVQSNMKRI